MNKVEQYLIQLMYSYRDIGADMWLVDDEEKGMPQVVVMYEEPLAVFRTFVMDAPQENRLEFFTKLLELNVDVVHGAYALENEEIVLVDALEYGAMDFEEFRAVLDSFGLALTQHYPILSTYRAQQHQGG